MLGVADSPDHYLCVYRKQNLYNDSIAGRKSFEKTEKCEEYFALRDNVAKFVCENEHLVMAAEFIAHGKL